MLFFNASSDSTSCVADNNLSSEISLNITRRFATRPPWCKYINALSVGLRHVIRPVVGDLATDRRFFVYSAVASNGRHTYSAGRVQPQFARSL